MLKEVCEWAVGCLMVAFAGRYVCQIKVRAINPALSTWIILLVGTGLSLLTYSVGAKHNFRSSILNTMDVVAAASILVAILIWGERSIRFVPVEKWCLGGSVAVVVYWFCSGNSLWSNVAVQFLMSVGYVLTIHKIIKQRRNTESFTGWGCVLAASASALYAALLGGNALAVLYVVRTIVLSLSILATMLYYTNCQKGKGGVPKI